ncbi:DUF4192 domain-containing protein [Kitasatospora purpeofusca]|uniref:DUF4192 family protein n=1 Tax=Kitasatospora purpeofusca TaxID=67352 RepID=UPI002E11CA60|nr:DUF4192 domain-containing protein [Kitasatospora purpeofusca]
MSHTPLSAANPAEAAELFRLALDGNPSGHRVVVMALSQQLTTVGTAVAPLSSPRDWPLLVERMIATAVHQGHRDVGPARHAVFGVIAPDGDDAHASQRLGPLARHFETDCDRRRLTALHSLLVTPTHWWDLVGDGTLLGVPTPGNPRLHPRGSHETRDDWTPVSGPGAHRARQAVEHAFAELGRELAAGHGAARRRFLALLDGALGAGGRAIRGPASGGLAVQVLVALQNGPLLDAAAELCETADPVRARDLWISAARLCVEPYRALAAAPLTLLALTDLLAGDLARARAVLAEAVAVKPEYAAAERLMRMVDYQEARVLTRGLDAVGLLHRNLQSGEARRRAGQG